MVTQPSSGDADSGRPVAGHGDALRALQQAIFLISLPLGFLGFILPVYGRELGADAVGIGLAFSVFSLVLVLVRPLVGAGLDRYGRRPFILAGLGGYALSMFVFAAWRTIEGVLASRAVQGLGAACLWIAVRALTADVAGADHRGRSFGGVDQARGQGETAGVLAAVAVSSMLSLRDPWLLLFAGYGVAGVIALLVAWRRLPETRPASSDAGRTERAVPWSRNWIVLLVISAITGATGAMVSPILLFFLQDRLGATVAEVGYAFLPAALVQAFLAARIGALVDRYGRKLPMILGMAVSAISSFLFPVLGSIAGLAALQVVQAACYVGSSAASQSLVADMTGGDRRGRAYGLYALAGGLGASLGPVMGGWVYERASPETLFVANGIVVAASTLALWAFLRDPRKGETHDVT